MDIRFGGNLDNARTFHTGCILCLDSCAVGITSNASYPSNIINRVVLFIILLINVRYKLINNVAKMIKINT